MAIGAILVEGRRKDLVLGIVVVVLFAPGGQNLHHRCGTVPGVTAPDVPQGRCAAL